MSLVDCINEYLGCLRHKWVQISFRRLLAAMNRLHECEDSPAAIRYVPIDHAIMQLGCEVRECGGINLIRSGLSCGHHADNSILSGRLVRYYLVMGLARANCDGSFRLSTTS
ncbi:hypothetical protein D3C77_698190 [compost metagenome]